MNWISVKDRLPEENQEVIAFGNGTCWCGDKGMVTECRYNNKEGFTHGEYDCGIAATHWQPLPEPPKD